MYTIIDICQKGVYMPRKPQCRCIQHFPDYWRFAPELADGEMQKEAVLLTLDEYETVRLLDYEQMTQADTAEEMGIARTTVTAIYQRARQKIATALVEGRELRLFGGACRLASLPMPHVNMKGEHIMRIAIPYNQNDGTVFQHYGKSEAFKLYDVDGKTITKSQVVTPEGGGHGAIATFLAHAKADVCLAGGMGAPAKMALGAAGIEVLCGVTGSADDAAKAYLAGTLKASDAATCSHHEGGCHGGHGEGHCHGGHC